MPDVVHYFAYGSNLWPRRLVARVGSCEVIGVGQLDGYALCFDKRGADGSGKCNLCDANAPANQVLGAIYVLNAAQFEVLHRYEGGYQLLEVAVQCAGAPLRCSTYVANGSGADLPPYSWYLRYVVEGARHHGIAHAYVADLEAVRSKQDPDDVREARERLR